MTMNDGTEKSAGLTCPVCGKFVPASISDLLAKRGLQCPSCGLYLEIDRSHSGKALEALEMLSKAQQQVEATRRFNR